MPDAPPRQTLDQYYSSSRLQKLTTSDTLDWNNARLELAKHEPISELVYSPYLDDDVLAFLMGGSALMNMHLTGGTVRREHVGPGILQLLSRHTVYGAQSKWNSAWTYGALQLDRRMVVTTSAELLRGDPEHVELVPTYGFNDALLYHLGVVLTHEMQKANPHGHLYADSLINRLTLHLLRHYSTRQVVQTFSSRGLTSAQLSKVDEYIHDHLDQRITLTDLATHLHLSVPHFERMFRAATHQPPYRYVLELRLEWARVLLERRRLPLAEVALRCGFSSQSHFTTHFTRYVGISPARFVRGVRQ